MSFGAKRDVTAESVREAFLNALSRIEETQMCPLEEAYGAVAAGDIFAGDPIPHFTKFAMDGYAVRAEEVAAAAKDAPVRLKVLGGLFAGDYREFDSVPFSAVRVMTGAPVPAGYDSVVRQEDTDYGAEEVCVFAGVPAGRNICRPGEDIERGELVIPAGRRLGRVDIGLLASLGIGTVKVRRPARIAILSTGSELVRLEDWPLSAAGGEKAPESCSSAAGGEKVPEPCSSAAGGANTSGHGLPPGKIFDSNSPMLRVSVARAGLDVLPHVCIRDEEEGIAEAIRLAAGEADFVITIGGVSVGQKDLLPAALARAGAREIFSRVNVQPGTPTKGSILDGTGILSLSGNPYAALAHFDFFFWPAMSVLMGSEGFVPEEEEAVMADSYEKAPRIRRWLRARVENGKVYLPESIHKSSVIHNLLSCNCYVDLAEGQMLKPGDVVHIRYMGG